MGVRAIDFRLDRAAKPRLSLVSDNKEPDLASLLRSKATDGPLQGAYISGPHNWDGVCRKGPNGPVYPGRYMWNGTRWIWKETSVSE